MLDKFAEELKSAREKSGLTIDQLAAKTRIDKKFIEAIDNGNFSFLPEIYVRAFIKEYAIFVGLDPAETLKKFKAASEGISAEIIEDQQALPEQIKPTDSSVRKKTFYDKSEPSKHTGEKGINRNMFLYSGSAVIIILIIAFLYFIILNDKPDIVVKETPYEEVINNTPERFVTEVRDQPVQQSGISDSLVLTIVSSGTSWVQIIRDNKTLEEFMLYPNSAKSVKAIYNYEMILGNSGSISLKLNSKQLDFTGEKGKVRYVKIDSSGLQYLSYRPTLVQE